MFKKIFFALTKSERLTFLAATLAAFISGVILMGLAITASTRAVPASGGEYTQGMLGQPIYVNPVIASSETDKSLARLVFANLGSLAEKIESSPDGRTWTVRLRENELWQDGEKLTSDDVIFTVQKIQDPATLSPLSNSWQGVAVQRLSELELQFTLINPYAFFGDAVRNLYTIPKHLFDDVPAANWKLSDYNLKPVGSGPYRFIDYSKRLDGFISAYKLAAWDKYSGNRALINNFNFEFFTSAKDLIKSFNSGAVDGIMGLVPQELGGIKHTYKLLGFKLPSYYAVFLNQSKSVPLKDPAVRRALDILADQDAITETALAGHGMPAFGPIPQETQYFDADLANTTTTSGEDALMRASSTLTTAGWKVDADGIRKKKVGSGQVPLELTLTVPQIDFLVATGETLSNAWQNAGFKINLDIEPPDDIAGGTIKNRDYEMLLFGNVLGKNYDLYSFWHSSQRFYPGRNLALYNNKNADALIESIRQELDDDKRTAEFKKLQDIIANDTPAIFLYSPDYLYVANKNLHGADGKQIAEPADIFSTAGEWYLKTARVLK
ncbi:MAG: peptide ABC transporter substrate-binding protein [Candidatus Liptonbacteria bacterium]|nr:peptide ABC transporter substrate-binding protein [Candidatus Liptonbacteria bacterium]